MDPRRPDYGGASLEGVVPALLGARPGAWLPAPVREARAVVLLLLDGLGWSELEAHRTTLPALGSMVGGPITTVAPSTTATALTSLTTGLVPAAHGVLGFRVRHDDDVLNVLRWQSERGRRPPDPLAVQRHDAFLGRSIPVVTKREFRKTGFTQLHLRGAQFVGWSVVSALIEECRRLVDGGERLVYAYYPGVDTIAHEVGLHDERYRAELRFADWLVDRLLDALPTDAALVVTADHGQVHVGKEGWVDVPTLQPLVDAMAGDGRFRWLHARRGAAQELLTAAQDLVGHQAWVMGREQLLDEGWLGPVAPSPAARRRIGDVVLAARDPVAFVDPSLRREAELIGAHGSLTPAEIEVPLIAAHGTA